MYITQVGRAPQVGALPTTACAEMAARQVLYSATVPIEGAAITKSSYEVGKEERGLVPYFVSGPLSRSGMVGLIGTLLHVAAWLVAVIFDIIIGAAIDQTNSPGAFTYWLWGFLTLMTGFIALVSVTIWHAVSSPANKIPEGGAPPFLMTLFIGGAQISLLLTLLQMVASTGNIDTDFFHYPNGTVTDTEKLDYRNAQRGLMVISMLSKVYIMQFLKNNQECKCYASSTSVLASVRCPFLNVLTCLVLCTQGPVPLASSRSRPPRIKLANAGLLGLLCASVC